MTISYQHVSRTILDIPGLPPTADQGISLTSILQTVHLVLADCINMTVGPSRHLVCDIGTN